MTQSNAGTEREYSVEAVKDRLSHGRVGKEQSRKPLAMLLDGLALLLAESFYSGTNRALPRGRRCALSDFNRHSNFPVPGCALRVPRANLARMGLSCWGIRPANYPGFLIS